MNILVVESSPIIGKGILNFIGERYPDFNVTLSGCHPEANEILQYEIIVLGTIRSMSPKQLPTLINTIVRTRPGTRVLVCETELTSYERVIGYFSAGAWGYACLSGPADSFPDAFDSVAVKGVKYLMPDVLQWLLNNLKWVFYTKNRMVGKDLTSKELEVAIDLIKGKSVTSIARQSQRKASTISTIKKKIFQKTNADNIIELKSILMH